MRWTVGCVVASILILGCAPEPSGPGEVVSRCVAPPRPPSNAKVVLQRVFPAVELEGAVSLVRRPGDDSRWYLAVKSGIVYTFENRADAEPTVFLDLSAAIQEEGEAGLLDLEFHPDFETNGEVFVSYNAPGGTAFWSRIARFTSDDGGLTADLSSQEVLLEIDQPYINHNGGDIAFGPDGFLYIGLGDGGSAGDPQGNGQDVQTLLGAMLRIDVDGSAPYAIPADNPFADGDGRPEIFAWGLRNPWRFTFDRATGDLWVGDVGQNAWEEVDVVRRGENYGWKIREGRACLDADSCQTEGLREPVAQYRNTGSASVVAGFVYRGEALQDLRGTFVFNDFYFGAIFGVAADGSGDERTVEILGEGARGIAGWAQDEAGELFGVDFYDGGVYQLVAAPPPDGDPDAFPRALSNTGCIDPDAPRDPGQGALPYAVNLPFWSDGADKERFIAIPEGRTATIGDDGDLDLPEGTVLVKSFFRDDRPIETRLFVRHDDGRWAGYGYAWDDEGVEATYVERSVTDEAAAGPWFFPETRECAACHTSAAGGSLGLELAQLVGNEVMVDGESQDQLALWVERGWIGDIPPSDRLPGLDDETASLDDRARAYLHVNCSPCHREEGPGGRSRLDLRRDTPLPDTGVCDANPRAGDLGIADARIVAPGDPARSVLLRRMRAEESARMPPLGSSVPDEGAAAVIESWIAGLQCP